MVQHHLRSLEYLQKVDNSHFYGRCHEKANDSTRKEREEIEGKLVAKQMNTPAEGCFCERCKSLRLGMQNYTLVSAERQANCHITWIDGALNCKLVS